jgi:uncharacterized membrane protein YidH (DUF202 family)
MSSYFESKPSTQSTGKTNNLVSIIVVIIFIIIAIAVIVNFNSYIHNLSSGNQNSFWNSLGYWIALIVVGLAVLAAISGLFYAVFNKKMPKMG